MGHRVVGSLGRGFAAIIVLMLGVTLLGASPATGAGGAHRDLATPDAVTTTLPGAVAVSPLGNDSTDAEPITILAGSADQLAFARAPHAEGIGPDPSFQPFSLFVVNAAGDVRSLGVQQGGIGWSAAGDLLTSTPAYLGSTINWVNLADGTSGSGSTPAGSYYLGATPTGWAYVKGNELFTETTSGTSTSLGFPLGNATGENVTSGGTGPNGALVADATSAVAYVPYADPAHPVVLSTLDLAQSDPARFPDYMGCIARTTDAICGVSAASPGALDFPTGERLSLTGGAPVAVPEHEDVDFHQFAIDDQATAIADGDGYSVMNADGSDLTRENVFLGVILTSMTSALNKIAVTNSAGTAIDLLTGPGDTPTVLVPPTPARVVATTLHGSSGRVAYLDDQVSPTRATQPDLENGPPFVWTRPVRSTNGRIKLGTASFVGVIPDLDESSEEFQLSGPLLSSATTAISLRGETRDPPTAILRPLRSTSVPSSIFALSGNRVLGNRVTDTVTGKVVGGTRHSGVLWGSRYCFLAATGELTCKDLDTGNTIKLKGLARGDADLSDSTLSIYADHVAWQEPEASHAKLVDLRHPHRRMDLPVGLALVSTTSNGVLLVKRDQATRRATYYLRGYGRRAATVKILTDTGSFGPGPSVGVDQSVLTWIDGTVVMAAPLPHVADPPHYLGDPVAPHHLNLAKQAAWRAYLPYSASLGRCTMTIRRRHHTLRTLRCDPADMKYGGAVVRWNGRDKHGRKVPAGTVTWTAHVANHDGHGLSTGGTRKPATGTIRVTR
jgi:hypothetical protein